MSSMSVRRTQDNNFSNIFSLFKLESKSYRTKLCWQFYGLPHRMGFFEIFLYIKTCILNYTIKSVRFDFRSTNVGSSVIKTDRSEGSLLPYFYRFQRHYPLIIYLSENNGCNEIRTSESFKKNVRFQLLINSNATLEKFKLHYVGIFYALEKDQKFFTKEKNNCDFRMLEFFEL